MSPSIAPRAALTALWQDANLPSESLRYLDLSGEEPALPSSFAVGTLAQVSIAAAALAAAELWSERGGSRQRVAVSMRHAALEFRSERYLRRDGQALPGLWDKIAGSYPCQDGRWVRLHTNFPHHRDGVLKLLGCAYERAAVAQALLSWDALEFEDAASLRGLCVGMARSFEEWDRHPQGLAAAAGPLYQVDTLGEAPLRRSALAKRPLAGIRVLDLTRIIAGPVCSRTLAAYGADVLHVTSPNLPSIESLVIDTGRGKRSCQIDLTTEEGKHTLEDLVREADVFVQGYRPGGLAELGFGPPDLARLRPGIVAVSLSAYGPTGPWSSRRGFDSLVQMTSGINWAEAQAHPESNQPRALPAQALDHSAGYLMAFAAITSLISQHSLGQSLHVQISLTQCGQWLRSLGRIEDGFRAADPGFGDITDVLEDSASGFGVLRAVRHAALFERTPAYWSQPSVPLGTDAPVWLPREAEAL